jgi:hypothetical protein
MHQVGYLPESVFMSCVSESKVHIPCRYEATWLGPSKKNVSAQNLIIPNLVVNYSGTNYSVCE